MEKNNLGLVHLYYGDGKGKTTASIGLTVRALGSDLNVLFVQFLKSGFTGELNSFSKFSNIKVMRNEKQFPFTRNMTEEQLKEIKEIHNNIFIDAVKYAVENKIDLLVLDELMTTYNLKLIDEDIVINFLRNKPDDLEIIITGHKLSTEIGDFADYISEIKKIKHPYDKGVSARKGIEF